MDAPGSDRARLIAHLRAAGVPDDAVERAAAQDRLVLLPAEAALVEKPVHSLGDIAARVGVDAGVAADFAAALGLPVPPLDAVVAGEEDLEAARALAAFLEAGIPAEPLLEVVRVGGQSAAALSRAMVSLMGRTLLRSGDSEYDLAVRLEQITRDLVPHVAALQGYAVRRHLLETIRRQVLSEAEISAGTAAGPLVAVAFADLSGFTRLGARVDAEETGRVASRLAGMAAAAVSGTDVQIVKLVGDAAMLAGPDPAELLRSLFRLNDDVEAEGEDFPALHSGAAYGRAVARAGDFFGHTVTLASRLSGLARPGSVLVERGVHDAVAEGGEVELTRLRLDRVRGLRDRVQIYRARPATAGQA